MIIWILVAVLLLLSIASYVARRLTIRNLERWQRAMEKGIEESNRMRMKRLKRPIIVPDKKSNS